jgi:hypothetical protein
MRVSFARTRIDGWLWLPILLAAAWALVIAFLPWETLGAPVLMLLLVGGVAIGWVLWDSPTEERRFVLRLFLVALGMRLLTTVLFYWATAGDQQYLYKDAIGYDRLAWILAQAWHNHGILPEALGPLAWIEDDAYPRALAVLYYIVGRAPGAAIAINAVLGAASVYLVYRISAILFGPVPARWAGWLAAFYSGLWLWGLMTLKDTLFLFILLLFFLALYRLGYLLALGDFSRARILRVAGWAVVLILTWEMAGAIRDFANYAGLAMAVSAAILPLVWFLRSGRVGRWLLLLTGAALCVAILWPKIASFPLPSIAVNTESLLFQATVLPKTGTVGAFLDWIIRHPVGFVVYFFLSTISTALAPYAWLLPGTLPSIPSFDPSMIAFPGLWLWYAVIPFSVLGFFQAVRRTKGDVWPMVVFGAGLFLVFSILIPREFRHRDMIMPFALMFAAEGLVFGRKWWYLGLFFWIPLVGLIAWKLHSPIPVLLAATFAVVGGVGWWVNRKRRAQDALPGKET